MGVPKTIRQLGAKGSALALTDLFAICAPSPAITDAVHVTAQDIVTLVGAVVASGSNGLSNSGANIVLGQNVGAGGNPALVTSEREIPITAGLGISFGVVTGNSVRVSPNSGISIGNDQGNGIDAQWIVGGFAMNWSVSTDDGNEVLMQFGNGFLIFNSSSDAVPNLGRFEFNKPLVAQSLGAKGGTVLRSASPTVTWGKTHGVIVYDLDNGNGNVSIDPTIIPFQFGAVKKKGTDINTITLTPLTGSIYGSSGAQATYVFSGAGESATFWSDGTDLFVV